ncbi:ABC transporter, permease protein [Marvinbryantia formatexigens DSM 14469]|uniref:ABC transporter, permease protein n=2 Tax=Marvinbryantia TaxID=248744 RepID=C6LF54_9FIRM|nr:ABC transporter, permease protein [Marvinbryantia formatexigens DSM 14469]
MGKGGEAMRKSRKFSVSGGLSYLYLTILAIVSVFPLLWLLVSAFKSSNEMLGNPTSFWPKEWTLENFKTVLVTLNFTVNIKNSLIVALSTTLICTVIAALAAYGIIRFFPKLGNIMTKMLITSYMFPAIMLVIPYAVVMGKIGLTNTRGGLVLVYLSFSVPYAVWMLIGFFKTVPVEIEEAARIDGANRIQVFARVVVPLVRPGIVSTAIYTFINAWNEFLYAMLLVSSSSKSALSVAVKTLSAADIVDWGALMAASALVVLPSIVFFCLIQNKLAGGLSDGAVK